MLRLAVFVLSAVVLVSSSIIRPYPKLVGPKSVGAESRQPAPYSPVGKCPNPQGNIPVFLPDSERCDIYYECSNGNPVQNYCTAGLEWNPVLNTCDFPDQANCQAGKPKKSPKAVHPFSPVGECPGHQEGPPTYLPDSEKCDVYYECSNGLPVQNHCVDGLEWNPTLNTCDFPDHANCQAGKPKKSPKAVHPFSPVGECPGHQEGPPTYLPDSEKCDVYYECSNGLPVQNHCVDGLEWNPTLNTCDFPDHANCQAGKPKKAPKAVHPFSPVGECPDHQEGPPTYLPDSEKCDVYYECSNGLPVQNHCVDGLEWNPALNTCDFPDHANCQAGKPKKAPKAIHPFSPVGKCPEDQGPYPVYLPDSESCSIFYECDVNGVPLPLSCEPGLEFNPNLHVCDWPQSAGCTAGHGRKQISKKEPTAVHPRSPVGQCPEHQGQYPVYLPDSKSCSIFYECNADGIPIPVQCPPDLEFNPILHVCDFPAAAGCTAGRSLCSSRSIVGECPTVPGQYPVYLPDDEDCSAFYECSNGVPIKLHCAPGTLFDSVSKRCKMASEATCQRC